MPTLISLSNHNGFRTIHIFNNVILSSLDLDTQWKNIAIQTGDFIQKLWQLVQVACFVTLIKFLTSLGFYQLYIMAIILALITGNHKRLYRRYCVDRESETKHQISQKLFLWLPSLGLILYLVLPFKINPMITAMTSSFILYLLLHYLIGSF